MSDDEKKVRYRRIVRKLKLANKKIGDLINSLDNLSDSLTNNLKVDGKGYETETVSKVRDKVDTLQDKNINIINSLVRKINQID